MRFPSRSSSQTTPPPNTGGQYFDRRGEVNELKMGLRSALAERNSEALQDNIRKVIMYLTLGIDMSRLFSEMVMASQLGDTVQKKMVYLYLTTYAEENADLAILAVNTLQKDTKDVDPSVRGLALRSLCSLHLSNMVEYLEPAITAGLVDPSGYVRKTAVLGVIKLSSIGGNVAPYTERIISLLKSDRDAMVVSNCISVLSELGLMNQLVDQELVYAMLNRFESFSEWAKCQAIDSILSLYYPKSDDEMFELMNVLDVYLKQTSAPVAFGIFKLFLSWTSGNTNVHNEVIARIKDPILTLLSASCTCIELQYSILQQIELVAKCSSHFRSLLNPNWKRFLVCDYDTLGSCKAKLQILSYLETSPELLSELCSYVCIPRISKYAVKALVGLTASSDVYTVVDLLMGSAQTQTEVAGHCLKGIGDILRKFPENASQLTENPNFIDFIVDRLATEDESGGIETLVWLLGRFDFDDAPYQLERLYEATRITPTMISSAVELFLKRPLETRSLLLKIFQASIDECTDPDTRDVGLFYFRMLKFVGVETVKSRFSSSSNDGVDMIRSVTPSDTEALVGDLNKLISL